MISKKYKSTTELYDDCNHLNKPKKFGPIFIESWVTTLENMRFETPNAKMPGVHISKEIQDAMIEQGELNNATEVCKQLKEAIVHNPEYSFDWDKKLDDMDFKSHRR